MAAIRITKQQVEEAAAARKRALAEDPDFRRAEEELAKGIEEPEKEETSGKESD